MGGTASVPVVVQDALKSLSQADQQQLQSRFAKATGSNDASSRVPTSTIQGWLSLMPSAVPCVLESWRAHLGLESQSSSPEHAAMMERDLFTVVTATVSSGSSLARAQLFAFVFWAFGRKTVEALAKQPCLPPLTLFEDVSFDHVHAAARQLVHTCLSSSEGDKKARQDGGSTLVGLLVQTLLDINDDDADTTAAAEKETVTATLNDIAR
ncbi:hypothetical protein PTSG_05422 [Salpingoeca rosetta]|uniref:Uncharacterized protein n=1 Tax=Salpingoeca rosetta (strain ATCC 50818 / BSB-021) TaxID=946362 RepID=F2UAE1_SALR5|nr:uncharacterized protein PTSG_05422 [Salpingoeca rosetta]EGD73716.1 hypothetical protein PTSG_05422 [Salpingoeca rosetta]|eukprot:XP_004993997.1 hypothetical protein PTSG_05422 [Salpingoeca rosetta]